MVGISSFNFASPGSATNRQFQKPSPDADSAKSSLPGQDSETDARHANNKSARQRVLRGTDQKEKHTFSLTPTKPKRYSLRAVLGSIGKPIFACLPLADLNQLRNALHAPLSVLVPHLLQRIRQRQPLFTIEDKRLQAKSYARLDLLIKAKIADAKNAQSASIALKKSRQELMQSADNQRLPSPQRALLAKLTNAIEQQMAALPAAGSDLASLHKLRIGLAFAYLSDRQAYPVQYRAAQRIINTFLKKGVDNVDLIARHPELLGAEPLAILRRLTSKQLLYLTPNFDESPPDQAHLNLWRLIQDARRLKADAFHQRYAESLQRHGPGHRRTIKFLQQRDAEWRLRERTINQLVRQVPAIDTLIDTFVEQPAQLVNTQLFDRRNLQQIEQIDSRLLAKLAQTVEPQPRQRLLAIRLALHQPRSAVSYIDPIAGVAALASAALGQMLDDRATCADLIDVIAEQLELLKPDPLSACLRMSPTQRALVLAALDRLHDNSKKSFSPEHALFRLILTAAQLQQSVEYGNDQQIAAARSAIETAFASPNFVGASTLHRYPKFLSTALALLLPTSTAEQLRALATGLSQLEMASLPRSVTLAALSSQLLIWQMKLGNDKATQRAFGQLIQKIYAQSISDLIALMNDADQRPDAVLQLVNYVISNSIRRTDLSKILKLIEQNWPQVIGHACVRHALQSLLATAPAQDYSALIRLREVSILQRLLGNS